MGPFGAVGGWAPHTRARRREGCERTRAQPIPRINCRAPANPANSAGHNPLVGRTAGRKTASRFVTSRIGGGQLHQYRHGSPGLRGRPAPLRGGEGARLPNVSMPGGSGSPPGLPLLPAAAKAEDALPGNAPAGAQRRPRRALPVFCPGHVRRRPRHLASTPAARVRAAAAGRGAGHSALRAPWPQHGCRTAVPDKVARTIRRRM